ncbi:MAG: hypothetical protein HY564_02330 [Candidatus Jacksonbacteria bacterium]|nr:hypothetical protein [Candidatus Jacksonbacteria bacterium]
MKKTKTLQCPHGSLNHYDVSECLLSCLNAREHEVITRRYGLHGGKKDTLEQIGRDHTITRERVRQIERASIAKIKRLQNYRETLSVLIADIDRTTARYGGIIADHHLISEILKKTKGTSEEQETVRIRNRLVFLLREFAGDILHFKSEGRVHTGAWSRDKKRFETLEATLKQIEDLFEKHGKPAVPSEIAKMCGISPDAVSAYLHLSKNITQNPFGMWGFHKWSEIRPRRMGDRIYLVIKNAGLPLHYREIANRISHYYGKRAHPPTVHNELIASPLFVLVGRGLYGLSEFGYTKGTVKEVVERVLLKAGIPLSRDDIVERVRKERIVARSTILLALNSNNHVLKVGKDVYKYVAPF